MKKFLFFLLFGIPLILFVLVNTRVQSSNLDFIAKATNSFEQKNYSFFLNPENVTEAEQLLAKNIQDLTPLLSNYKPLDQLIQILPDLLKTYHQALLIKPKIQSQSFNQVIQSPEFASIQNILVELEDLLNQTEFILASNQANIQKLPTLQPLSKLNSTFRFFKDNNRQIFNSISNTRNLLSILNNTLGLSKPHTILLLVQNNNEIRATGGFIGLLGFLEVDNAQIKSLEFQDIYDFDGAFSGLDSVPLEFQDDNQKLFIRDFNFSPDFPSVALQIEKYLQQNKAPSFDTIVAINHDVFRSLGPFIDTIQINKQTYNFSKDLDFILSYLVESKSHGNNSSKSKISEMLQSLPEQMLSKSNPEQLLKFILTQVDKRNIQVVSKNKELDKALSKLNFRQDLSSLTGDSQMLAFNSVSGTKGDRFIDRHITFLQDFSQAHVTTEVTVNLEHTYTNQTEWILNSILKSYGLGPMSRDLRFILGRGDYQAFIRAYLPDNSELIASDIKLFESPEPYNNQTSFVGGFGITPDKITRFSFTYESPINFSLHSPVEYRFENLYQSGLKNTKITHIINLENINLHTFSPKNYNLKNNRLINTQEFLTDYKAEFLISPKW
jgi:hypothetical protein